MKVLGKSATMALIKPYLASDGNTLCSGVGVDHQVRHLSAYNSLL